MSTRGSNRDRNMTEVVNVRFWHLADIWIYAPPYTPDASLTRALSEIGRDRGTVEAGMSCHDETV